MKASVAYLYNPFNRHVDREIKQIKRARLVSTLDPKWSSKPYIALHNGQPLLRAEWKKTKLADGDTLAFIALPQGGGGSNPLRIVMMIAISAFAAWAAPAILAGTPLAGSALATGLLKAGIGLIGSQLINAIMPPPKPPSTHSMREMAAASPVYSLAAQGNQARLGSAIPVVYGRHLLFPDFAAQPYTKYMSNEQYLYQLFCLGQGEFDVESIRIEDTPIANFEEVTTELVMPGQNVTLFPTNIVTAGEVSGQEALLNDPLGGFILNAPGTQVSKVYIDIACPTGLFYANDEGGMDERTAAWRVEGRRVDDSGNALEAYSIIDAVSITQATNTPVRRSYEITVPLGRWQVRLTRTNPKETDARGSNTLTWAGLRGWVNTTQNYGNVTMLAVKMKASNALSGQANRKVNVIATRRLKTWNPTTGWSLSATPTKSIAWAALDMCVNSEYGAGMDESRIDMNQLFELDALLGARGDYFCGVFDSQLSFWEALTQVCRPGRVMPVMQGGVVNFVRDQQQTLHTAMFTPRNIVKNTLKIEYVIPTNDTVDSVEVEFMNEATWKTDTVSCVLPGGTNDRPAKIKLFGVTNRNQAWREGMYVAAQNTYRRKMISFDTELDGHIPAYGDLIALAHDMPSWAQSGEVVDVRAVTGGMELDLTNDLTWQAGQTHYVALRRFDGSVSGPHEVTQVAPNTVMLTDTLDFTPNTDIALGERTYYSFGAGAAYRQRVKVTAVRPSSDMRITVHGVNENDLVHTVDGGTAPVELSSGWALDGDPAIPSIPAGTFNLVSSGSYTNPKLSMSWGVAKGATHYKVEHSVDNASWTEKGLITGTTFSMSANPGGNYIRVTPLNAITLGASVNAYLSLSGEVSIPNAVPPQLVVTANNGLLVNYLDWTNANYEVATNNYEVWRATDPEVSVANAQRIAVVRRGQIYYTDQNVVPGTTYNYWVRIISNNNIAGPFSVMQSATPRKVGVGDTDGTIVGGSAPDETPPGPVTGVTVTTRLGTNSLRWANPNDSTLARVQIWRNTANDRTTATLIASELGETFVDTEVAIGTTYYYWLRTIDFASNLGPFEPDLTTTSYFVTTDGIAYADLDPNVQFEVQIQDSEVTGVMIAAGAVTAEKTKSKRHMIY